MDTPSLQKELVVMIVLTTSSSVDKMNDNNCTDCSSVTDNCKECSGTPLMCTVCEDGYTITPEGTCGNDSTYDILIC